MAENPGNDHSIEQLYRTVTSERLSGAVVKQLEALIAAERLNAGDAIPSERRLSELFGVSRSVIREAMRTLERAGLVAIKPGRGAFVLQPSAETVSRPLSFLVRMRRGTIRDCVEFRRFLEPAIARLAAQRRTDADIAALQRALEGMDAVAHDPEEFIEYDLGFHSALAEASANPVFLLVLDSTISLMQETRQRTMHVSGAFERDRREHRAIYERIVAGDPDGAEQAMIDHLASVVRQIESVDGGADTVK
jgi:GntR family transcriptional regulator, transcriptional repressor for pyruvate dehydrogenase complex